MNRIEFESFDDIMHNTVFSVPDYQRDYAWTRGEIETLLEDIKVLCEINGVEGTEKHFCGSIVAIDFDEHVSSNTKQALSAPKLKNFDKLNVIDGQQRLATISVLAIAIRDYAESIGQAIDDMTDLLDTKKKTPEGKNIPKLNFQFENTQICYNNLLFKTNESFKKKGGAYKLNQAYKICLSTVEEFCSASSDPAAQLSLLYEQVESHLSFVGVRCTQDDDAYQIFESLNATGLSLTPAEQIKNLVLMKSAAGSQDQTLKKWETISEYIEESSLVAFFAHHLFYDKNKRVLTKDVYKEYKKSLDRMPVSRLLAELEESAKIYHELKNPSAANKAFDILLDFKDLGQEQSYVPLLALGRRFGVDSTQFRDTADAVLVFIVRFIVCGQGSNKLDGIFSRAIPIIKDESKSANDIVAHFREEMIDDDIFADFFAHLKFEYKATQQRVAKTILRRIETKSHGAQQPLQISRDDLTVEHIIPKQPNLSDLRLWLGDDAIDAEGFDLVEFTNQTIKSVGNLALLFNVENASINNSSYNNKVAFYSSSYIDKNGCDRGVPAEHFMLIKELIEEYPDFFDDHRVDARARKLAAKAASAWS